LTAKVRPSGLNVSADSLGKGQAQFVAARLPLRVWMPTVRKTPTHRVAPSGLKASAVTGRGGPGAGGPAWRESVSAKNATTTRLKGGSIVAEGNAPRGGPPRAL